MPKTRICWFKGEAAILLPSPFLCPSWRSLLQEKLPFYHDMFRKRYKLDGEGGEPHISHTLRDEPPQERGVNGGLRYAPACVSFVLP